MMMIRDEKLNILFIAPIPPPLTGQSIASDVLLRYLQRYHTVKVVDYSKETLVQGVTSIKRIIEVIRVLLKIWLEKDEFDIIYLTVSQSVASNLRDLITYLICFRKLSKMIIHLHGGGIKKIIFDRYRILYQLNKFFLQRIGGAIVLGPSLVHIFEGMIPPEKIFVVPNFSEDYLFLNRQEIKKKHKIMNPLKILFLSNLITGKGHKELVYAFQNMDIGFRNSIIIDFAGEFESENQKKEFLMKIKNLENIKYHGIAEANKKKKLLSEAHIFCLPTYYYYEGQPVSILEAYANGCVVVTTNHAGINDIFKDGINGFEIKKRSAESIISKIKKIIKEQENICSIALNNWKEANEKYRAEIFCWRMNNIIQKIRNAY